MDLQESPATIQGKEDDNVHTFQVPSDIHLKVQMYHIRDTKAFFIVGLSPWYRSAEDMMRREDDNVSISSSLIGKCFIASLLASSLPGTLASVSLSGSKGTCQDFSEGSCNLSENNIIHHDRFVDSPAECQVNITSA